MFEIKKESASFNDLEYWFYSKTFLFKFISRTIQIIFYLFLLGNYIKISL